MAIMAHKMDEASTEYLGGRHGGDAHLCGWAHRLLRLSGALPSCELPGQGGGTSSRLTNRPAKPVNTMVPAHKCTDHHTPTVTLSAAKCSVVRRQGTTVAKSRQAPGRCTD